MNNKDLINEALFGELTVYEYIIHKTSDIQGILRIESVVNYKKMTDEQIDDYDNKLYLSYPHTGISISSVNKDEIIDKISECNTILFCLVKDIYTIDLDKNFIVDLGKYTKNKISIYLDTDKNLNLFDENNFKILTWTDFYKCGYVDRPGENNDKTVNIILC